MSELLPFIIAGLTSGAVYGLAGVGLVLTYKTTGVFNFAHGAIAAVGAYAFYTLNVQHGVAWPVAAALAVLVLGPLLGMLLELIARRLQDAGLAAHVAATVGLLLVIEALVVLIYGNTVLRTVDQFLPGGGFTVAGTHVDYAQAVTLGFALAVTAALSIMLRVTRLGLAMRAVVDNASLLDLSGTSAARTRRAAWMIGCALAAASGVLFAPLLPLDPIQLTMLVVAAFGAAAVGAFTSLPLTFGGGLLIGVLAALSTKWFTLGALAGLPPAFPFIVLFVTLLVLPRKLVRTPATSAPQTRLREPLSWPAYATAGTLLLAALAAVPAFAGIHLTDWTVALGTSIVFLGLGLLVCTSGQVSLAVVPFMAIGAAAFSHLSIDEHVPWVIALAAAGGIAVPVGAVLAIPAIRLNSLSLALATFGFGVLVQYVFYTQRFMFGDSGAPLDMPRPAGFAGDRAFYYVVLAIVAIAFAVLAAIDRGRLGRLLRGMAGSPLALQTNGTAVNVTRVLVFCLSAAMIAVGGALVGVAQTTTSADAYPPLLSLTFFALVMIVGGSFWSALVAAGALILVPAYVAGDDVSVYLQLLFGAAALGRMMLPASAVDVSSTIRRTFGTRFSPGSTARPAARGSVASPPVSPGALEIEGLQVRFGGIVAVDGLSLRAPTGRITGLIGPNGAGKSTTFDACSGLVVPSAGSIVLDGSEVSRSSPSARARAGLGRTFQRMELFDSLSVRENVAIGAEGPIAGANPLAHLASRRAVANTVAARTDEALELCGIERLASAAAGALSTGQRRLVELARCLAGPYRILLLDEPSSGLDRTETARFGAVLQRLVDERGVGILLVEHDMSLVLDVCEVVYVLDFGQLIFEGAATELVTSPVVQAAYLGDVALEAAPSVRRALA